MTKAQRHEFYKKLLEAVCYDPNTNTGLCKYLGFVFYTLYPSKTDHRLIKPEDFKELREYRPKRLHKGGMTGLRLYWAPTTPAGWRTRIKWIEQAIEETKPNKKCLS